MTEELSASEVAQGARAEQMREAEAPGPDAPEPSRDREGAEPLAGARGSEESVDAQELLIAAEAVDSERARLKAIIEAVIYITDEPLTAQQIAGALNRPIEQIKAILEDLTNEYAQPDRGLNIREVADGYKMATKPEHHEEIRAFVKNLKPPLKLSLAALETLAVIAYKQPITAPEIMEIRGVQGAGVLKTLLDRKLIATAGRKNVVGKPILYKTTREFLVQFGLKDLNELPTLKEFEELGRFALTEAEAEPGGAAPARDPESAPVEEPDAGEPPIEEPPSLPDESAPPEEAGTGETNA